MSENQVQQYRWWQHEGDRAAVTIFTLMRHWDTTQGAVQASNLRNMRLYANRDVASLSIAQYVLSASQEYMSGGISGGASWNRQSRITLNVVKSCIDTLYSKIGKNKVKPTFLTTGGSIKHRQRAMKLNNFMFGTFWEGDIYNTAPMAFKDAMIFGTGFIKVYTCPKTKRIKYDRIFPDEITCDPADGYYGKPRQLFQRRFVSRDYLMEQFPERKNDILSVKQTDISYTGAAQDTILVCEAWHLGDDGKHVISIDGVNLFTEYWKQDNFPFVVIRYTEQSIGFLGCGVCEELLGIQVEINRLLLHIQESMRLISHPRIFIETGSKVNPRHIVNEIGTFIPYTGTPPIIQAAQSVHPEQFQQLENLYQKAFQICGVSALSAMSQKPAGLNSGAAISEYNDIETERFARTGQQYEQVFLDLAKLTCIELDKHPNYRVNSPQKDAGLERLVWKDIRLPQDEYAIQCFPTSALPKTPAMRLQHVKDMMDMGVIDPMQATELLDFPDLEAYNRITLSPIRLAYKIVEGILFDGKYVGPEPFFDLHLMQLTAQKYYSWALTLDEVDEGNLDLLRQFMDDIESLKAQAAMQAQANMPPTPQDLGLPMPEGAQMAPQGLLPAA